MSHDEYLERRQKALPPIRAKFLELQTYFLKKEIALDNSTVGAMDSFLQATNELLADLSVSNVMLQQREHEASHRFWRQSYDTLETKLKTAKDKIKKDFSDVIRR